MNTGLLHIKIQMFVLQKQEDVKRWTCIPAWQLLLEMSGCGSV